MALEKKKTMATRPLSPLLRAEVSASQATVLVVSNSPRRQVQERQMQPQPAQPQQQQDLTPLSSSRIGAKAQQASPPMQPSRVTASHKPQYRLAGDKERQAEDDDNDSDDAEEECDEDDVRERMRRILEPPLIAHRRAIFGRKPKILLGGQQLAHALEPAELAKRVVFTGKAVLSQRQDITSDGNGKK
jgi:hypothetical protein